MGDIVDFEAYFSEILEILEEEKTREDLRKSGGDDNAIKCNI